MNHVIALLIPTLFLIGCGSTSQIASNDLYYMINAKGRERRATITVQVDSVVTEYEGDYVTIGRDSVQWLDPETQLGRTAATVNLRRICFTDRAAGAFDGGMLGLI